MFEIRRYSALEGGAAAVDVRLHQRFDGAVGYIGRRRGLLGRDSYAAIGIHAADTYPEVCSALATITAHKAGLRPAARQGFS